MQRGVVETLTKALGGLINVSSKLPAGKNGMLGVNALSDTGVRRISIRPGSMVWATEFYK